jgi:DNA polymerase-3 subunit epsilon
VPRYVLGLEHVDLETLNHEPALADVLADLLGFLHDRPVVAQEAALARAFLEAEVLVCGRRLPDLEWLDLGALAERVLGRGGKPTLDLIAARCDIPTREVGGAEARSRLVAEAGSHLLRRLGNAGVSSLAELKVRLSCPPEAPARAVLRQTRTAHQQPDAPGVYMLRGADAEVLYVGKARRLRERLSAYTSRPLGPTRRMEGLVDSVTEVASETCQTELEALVLEARRIAQLRPRARAWKAAARPAAHPASRPPPGPRRWRCVPRSFSERRRRTRGAQPGTGALRPRRGAPHAGP